MPVSFTDAKPVSSQMFVLNKICGEPYHVALVEPKLVPIAIREI
jgi:hypothetical protein